PIAMKILSPQITHKSDVGGVTLNLGCDSEVHDEYTAMILRAKEKQPDADIIGVTIQKMVKSGGYELILGSKKDPVFGSVILFGLGGIYTELLKDRSIGFPPLNQVLTHRIIERTKAYTLLKGFRGKAPVNIKHVEETIINFSQLVIDHPEIKEIDINPLIASGDELIAVDARIIIDPNPQEHPHLIISPYPKKYVKTVTLKDDDKVLLRPIKPEDENLWHEMFKSFSQETIRFRFFRIIKDTPHEIRTRYCNIDYDREIGIVAEIQENDHRRLLGVTRIIVNPGDTTEAEFAIVVSDSWHRKGLGSEFIDYTIEIAKDKKLKKLTGTVLKDNYPMISLCREKHFSFSDGDPGEYKIEYDLVKDPFNTLGPKMSNGKEKSEDIQSEESHG
ncbi:MAG: GNAT family N-acetyltransferase, partial [Candidatus Thermoplasmatota archaeon]|nr:GNAT family N-acetyltransferase [Candidatus Thermoplasmatota archaeon]